MKEKIIGRNLRNRRALLRWTKQARFRITADIAEYGCYAHLRHIGRTRDAMRRLVEAVYGWAA